MSPKPSILTIEPDEADRHGYLVRTSSTIEDLSPYEEEMALVATITPTFTQPPVCKIAIGARSPEDSGKWARWDHSLTIWFTDSINVGELVVERYETTIEAYTVGNTGNGGGQPG